MITSVYFCSEDCACQLTPRHFTGIISITGNHEADLREGWGDVLRLKFDDIDTEMTSKEAQHYRLFEGDDAVNVLNWLEENEDIIEQVIVHCAAGISRSAAVAKFIAEHYKIKNFNHQYTLYNKHVYRVLREAYYKDLGYE